VALLVVAAVVVANLGPRALGIGEASHAYDGSDCGDVRKPSSDLDQATAKRMIVCLLNFERTARGLGPLSQNALLDAASQAHSNDMVERHFFKHDAPDGTTPQDRMAAAGYVPGPNGMTGENIAWGEDTAGSPASIVDELMHSPHHRDNILRPQFTEVGVGLTLGDPPRREPTDLPSATYTTDFGG
jgi:uncharacterized protein YkwD